MQGAAQKALEALHHVLDDEQARPADRVAAARVLLDYAHRAARAIDLEERVAAAEEELEARREEIQ